MAKLKTTGYLKKNWLNMLMILLSVGILAAFVGSSDFPVLVRLLWNSRQQWYWLVCAVLCIVVYWVLEAACMHVMLSRYCPGTPFWVTMRTVMVGQFFNQTTPFATGGQPMQAYAMSKAGIGVGISTSVLITRYIVYQTVVTVYGAVLMGCFYDAFASTIPGFGVLVCIGLAVSSGLVLVVVFLLFFPKFTTKTVHGLIRFLTKIHLVKHEEKLQKQADDEMNQFFASFPMLKQNLDGLAWMVLLTVLQVTVFLSIPYFIYVSFKMGYNHYFKIVGATGFVTLIASYFPTPGATGASELSFYAIFTQLFGGKEKATAGMLLWRVITFYLPILVGSGFALKLKQMKDHDNSKAPVVTGNLCCVEEKE